jgi:hypothetical protein
MGGVNKCQTATPTACGVARARAVPVPSVGPLCGQVSWKWSLNFNGMAMVPTPRAITSTYDAFQHGMQKRIA